MQLYVPELIRLFILRSRVRGSVFINNVLTEEAEITEALHDQYSYGKSFFPVAFSYISTMNRLTSTVSPPLILVPDL